MTAKVFLLFSSLFIYSLSSEAKVIPQITTTQEAEATVKQFSNLFSSITSNSSTPLGTAFSFDASAVYKSNTLNSDADSSLDSVLFSPIFTIQKGLYWNFDAFLSFIPPGSKNVLSGYNLGLHYTYQFSKFIFKPNFYLFNYNINDVLAQRGSGLTLLMLTRAFNVYWGLGLNIESVAGSIQDEQLSSGLRSGASDDEEFALLSEKLIFKILKEFKTFSISASTSYRDKDNRETSLSIAFKF